MEGGKVTGKTLAPKVNLNQILIIDGMRKNMGIGVATDLKIVLTTLFKTIILLDNSSKRLADNFPPDKCPPDNFPPKK